MRESSAEIRIRGEAAGSAEQGLAPATGGPGPQKQKEGERSVEAARRSCKEA